MPETLEAEKSYTTIPIRALAETELEQLSSNMKLSLDTLDMQEVQKHYQGLQRDPTCVELEVIAQTWSEHCKHRIFNALIQHETENGPEEVDSLFKQYIRDTTFKIMEDKPGFVLSAFHDNAGFIELDDNLAICLKAETHNHPSAIEPYAGANTGVGGVVRDILGAGKGATPIASLDVFCFGRPDHEYTKELEHAIHPIGILRGVVRGVRDYGNRMGIPTVTGAIHFDYTYLYNPLVFVGTAGVIERKDIDKEIEAGMYVAGVGGRTGRDGLHGATFSSAALTTESQVEDQQAVQIGNPIEEKKACDFIIRARDEGLLEFVTDCGAGGWSSAAGEMISESGGEIFLDNVPLKEPDLLSWEIFVSESQERMVFACKPENWTRLQEIAEMYQTELSQIGLVDDSKELKITHHDETVCHLDAEFLHEAPRKNFSSKWIQDAPNTDFVKSEDYLQDLVEILSHVNICSRESIIREYDHEVQGNTIIKPLAGPGGDNPQDGSVIRIDGSEKYMSMSVALLPQYGITNPYNMGLSTVDECIRQMVGTGANPDKLAILDNFCMGNPDDETELGRLVETVKGICEAATVYGAPFVSGKDSFYNYFETDEGPVSIPVTILVSGMGVIEKSSDVVRASLRKSNSKIALMGHSKEELGGSAYHVAKDAKTGAVPGVNLDEAMNSYRALHKAIQAGLVLSSHDCSEGGLAVALAEFGFSGKGGLNIDRASIPKEEGISNEALLFGESSSRILLEVAPENEAALAAHFEGLPFAIIGESTDAHQNLNISGLIDAPIKDLKASWKTALTPYY